jgi:oxygen-independent coproporphyrinogen III oxidase
MLAHGPIAIYVHVPFCATKCSYCDFNTYASIEGLMEPYAAALRTELEFWSRELGSPAVSTVFFGGGTPSYLRGGQIASLMGAIGDGFELDPSAEVTAEANPDDLTADKLAEFAAAGFNRLSIGVQSLDDGLLQTLGRRHDAAEAERAVRRAQQAGFDNLSVDLMYGLPDQTLAQWLDTMQRALELGPQHISMYGLTLEPGTPMEHAATAGSLPTPDADLAADMYLAAQALMAERGLRHYEISNWCLPGFEAKHNLTYWHNGPFLGVGPGAHSYLNGSRFSIIRSPREYALKLSAMPPVPEGNSWPQRLGSISFVDEINEIKFAEEMAETMMMGMRLDEGVADAAFSDRFGQSLENAYGPIIAGAQDDGLVEWAALPTGFDRALRLTPRGRLLGNEVFSRFFDETN